MTIWTSEIKELEKLYDSFKGQMPELEKEIEELLKTDNPVVILVYARRSLEIIVNELCETELNRLRKTEPLKGIIDKLNSENKVPEHIITSMLNLNSLSNYGAHPKDFEPEQVKPVLNNLHVVLKWYLKYRNLQDTTTQKPLNEKTENHEFSTKSNPKKRKFLLVLGISVIVITVLVIVLFKLVDKFKKDADIASLEKSIAVLPFKYLSTDKEKQYQADGMMDAILLHLSKIKDLTVISRTSVEQYRDTKKTMHDIGKELDVSFILEGTFQKEGDKVKLIVQLLRTENENHVWANEYNRDWKDVFEVQSEVAQAIAEELDAAITPEVKLAIEKAPTVNLTAYDKYQRGRNELLKYSLAKNTVGGGLKYSSDKNNAGSIVKAETLFKETLKSDPNFAQAYSALAMVYYYKNYYKEYFKEEFMDSVIILSDKALSLDNKLAEAYYMKGSCYYEKAEFEKAEKEFDKAIEFNPNDWMAYLGKGNLVLMDDQTKAIENLLKAASLNQGPELPLILNPLVTCYFNAGFFDKAQSTANEILKLTHDTVYYYWQSASLEYLQNNYKKSIEYLKMGYQKDSTDLNTLSDLGFVYSFAGQFEESLIYFKKYIARLKLNEKFDLNATQRIAYTFWKNGFKKEADYYFDKQMEYCEKSISSGRSYRETRFAYYDLAGIYAFRGDREKAYENLRIFNKRTRGMSWMVFFIKNDPLFDSLRGDADFQQIVKDQETKYNEEHEWVRKWLESQGKL